MCSFAFCTSLLLLAVLASAEGPEYNCAGDCFCRREDHDDGVVEISCPKYEPELEVYVKPDEYLYLSCGWIGDTPVLKWLDGLQVGPVERVQYRACSIARPISQLLKHINATNVKTLTVEYSIVPNAFENSAFDGFETIVHQHILSDNNSADTTTNLFQDNIMENVTFLEMIGNEISEMPYDFFNHSIANVTHLAEDILSALKALRTFSLMKNNFSVLPKGLFSGTKELETLLVGGNRRRLELPDGLLSNLTQLRKVSLSSSNISHLPENLWWGSSAIEHINLGRNALSELPVHLFKDAFQLILLDISKNKLTSLPDTIFAKLSKLRMLNLSGNQLTSIKEPTFQNLGSLEKLYIADNRLKTIDTRAFFNNPLLKKVDLSHNFLTFASDDRQLIRTRSPLARCRQLEEINLANNSLKEIFRDWHEMIHLSKLNLRFNKIALIIDFEDLLFLSNTIVVDLSHNQITVVDLTWHDLLVAFANSTNQTKQSKRKFILKNNPLECDCQAYSLLQYMERNFPTPQVYQFMEIDTEGLTCTSGQLLSNFKSTSVRCELRRSDMRRGKCPLKCGCFYRLYDSALIIDCSNVGLREAPKSLPLQPWLEPDLNHTEVFLRGNKIKSLSTDSLPGYKFVSLLDVSDNKIKNLKLSNNTFMPNLKELKLHGNRIRSIDALTLQTLENLPQLKNMSFYENQWQCDCEAAGMVAFVQINFEKLDQRTRNMKCTNGSILSQLSAEDLCKVQTASQNALVIAASLTMGAMGIVVGLLAALYYRYQQEVKVWLFARGWCLWLVTEEELDKDKLYDAFISYSHRDEEFIVTQLVPGLESGPNPLKLCLHFRDWLAGEYIPDQIGRSVDDSRRTVVVLSPNFVESVWGRLEFRAAHTQALSEGRARLVVVVYQDVGPVDDLDAELKAYLSMNTYVKWGDPRFWDRLRYALPHNNRGPRAGQRHNARGAAAREDNILMTALQDCEGEAIRETDL